MPHPNVARVFLRQTFGLGGEQEKVEDGLNTIAGKRDVSRLTFTVGKMSVGDIFDDNAYSHDPRTTFMNWSIWEAGAFDYAADQVGYTWGAVAELNQPGLGAAIGLFHGAAYLEREPVRRSCRRARQFGARTRDALFRVQPAWQITADRFSQPHKFRQLPGDAGQPRTRSRHRADAADAPKIRLYRQRRAGSEQGHRPVRALELEQRQERDHGVHRHRRQPRRRHGDQGNRLGPAERQDRSGRCDQRALGRPSRRSSPPAG